MPKVIEAVYENGVFKPLEKVELKEGRRIRFDINEGAADIIEKFSKRVEKDLRSFRRNAMIFIDASVFIDYLSPFQKKRLTY